MASRKTPSKSKSKASKPPIPTDPDLDLARRGVKAHVRASREGVGEDRTDDDDGDDDDDADDVQVTYDPRTHGVYPLATHSALPTEMCTSLANGERHLRDLVTANANATAKSQESLFTGFATQSGLASQQLSDAYTYGNGQRDRGDRLQEDLNKKNLEISHMVRQSEEARLERERLATNLEQQQLALTRVQMELDAKSRDKKAELDAVVKASAPVFAAVATGAAAFASTLMPKVGGLPAATAAATPANAAAGQTPAPTQPDQAEVSLVGAAEWQASVIEVLRDLKTPEIIASLRAMLCTYALSDYGAPPLPAVITKDLLFNLLANDLGQARVIEFLQSCRTAYVTEQQGAAAP